MFELNGYWQRAEFAISENSGWLAGKRAAASGLAGTGKTFRAGYCRTTIRVAEKYLAIPTFIRRGRKITV